MRAHSLSRAAQRASSFRLRNTSRDMVGKSHNGRVARGIERLGRSAAAKRRHFLKGVKKTAAPAKAAPSKAKVSKYYPADDVPKPIPRRFSKKGASLRSSITPGTVLILVAGKYKGQRVVFLKQLPSGLLLVTGPYAVNGVPLRRVNQAYVIATSTKVDLSSVKVDAKFDDKYFARQKAAGAKKAKGETEFFADTKGAGAAKKEKKVVDPARKADQKAIDSQLIAVINKQPLLKSYMTARFTLGKGQYPHDLKF